MIRPTSEQLRQAVEAAKARIAARDPKYAATLQQQAAAIEAAGIASAATVPATIAVPQPTPIAAAIAAPTPTWIWNAKQKEAIQSGVYGKSFVLIGAAGTGKTTTLRGVLREMLASNAVPMLKSGTDSLAPNTPGIVLVSFTRRAVRNIARQMPAELKTHCLTIHKLLEYGPEKYEDYNEKGELVWKQRFVPYRNRGAPLPSELTKIVVDESSMVSIDLFEMLLDALPNIYAVQFIFLGDLNQLPPVYGDPILGQKLLQLPIIELTEVYRQALLSPIIALALAVKNNNFAQFNKDAVEIWTDKFKKDNGKPDYLAFDARDLSKFTTGPITLENPGHGKVTLQVWKKRNDTEIAIAHMAGQIKKWIADGYYNPDEDMMLCPWGKSFGAKEINNHIADKLAKMRSAVVWEVICGFEKHYYAVGDKLMVDKKECFIEDISHNPKYLGKRAAKASTQLDRWGNNADHSIGLDDFKDMDVDMMLESLGDVEDRKTQTSHILRVKFMDDDQVEFIDNANLLNLSDFAYCTTVHKAQGSECRKVFLITHYCHSAMCFRELIYTAITRAAEEIHIVMSPMMLAKAANKPRIKGDTLKDKLDFYRERLKERLDYENEREEAA